MTVKRKQTETDQPTSPYLICASSLAEDDALCISLCKLHLTVTQLQYAEK